MKKHKLSLLLLSTFIFMWVQVTAQSTEDIELDDVVVVEDTEPAPAETEEDAGEAAVVVEIPDVEVEGASIDVEAPVIPEATEVLPGETEIVLEIPGQDSQSPGEATMAGEETISVDFPEEDVRVILRNVADLFELNLVIPDTLQGRTSVKLRNITWRQVFEVVLEPLGFTYVEDRNIIRVKSIAELTTEPVDTRVFVVNFARASEIQGSISPLIDASVGGQVKVDKRSNALVITERPSRMNNIQEIIDSLDKPTEQVMIESKFIEVTQDDLKNVGVNWASLSGYSASAGPFQREWTRDRSSSEDNQAGATSSTSSSSSITTDEFGVTETTSTGSQSSGFNALSDLVSNAATSRSDTAVFSADQFEVILSALKTNNDIKLVSNPTVVTLDNKEAKIAIGEKYPIPNYSFNAETGERQLNDIDYEDIGIKLDVTPQVSSAGFINLSIIPEVSSRLGVALVEGTEIPIIASRRAETNIMIKDGFTLAIGGLSENETSNESTRVPLLGDLPGVGRLFRSNSDRIEQRNLIIFITAKTLNPDGSTYRDVIDPRMIDEMDLIPAEIPGYQLPTDQREALEKLEVYRAEAQDAEMMGEAKARMKQIEYKKQQAEEKRKSER